MMRAASTLMLLHLATVSGQACSNACSYANDGTCDDGGADSAYHACPLGSDCADCGARNSITTHCTCDTYNAFLNGNVINTNARANACTNAKAGCSFASVSCILNINNNVGSFTWNCAGPPSAPAPATAAAPSTPTPATTPAATGACAGMSNTDHCCKDGAPDDYPCGMTDTCGKGQCVGITKKLCTDAESDYVCGTTKRCGRGNCVDITDTLCGTSGTTTCQITETCCGATAATKDTDMVCNGMMDTCPADRISTSYSAEPYTYSETSDLATCFSRETEACRIINTYATPSAAFRACFDEPAPAVAERVKMTDLTAGDYVLSAGKDLAYDFTRVIVNQHKLNEACPHHPRPRHPR